MLCYKCKQEIKEKDLTSYGMHQSCFLEWFVLDKFEDFKDISRKNSSSESSEDTLFKNVNSSFFQGKFKKYSAKLATHSYILKVEEKDFPDLPATEFLSNQIADFLGILVPEYYFIDFHGLKTFVSKNFIDPGKRIALHHIYHYLKKGDSFDVKTLVRIIETQTGRISEIERFIELCLFDALIGNHDRHGRNLAFIEERGRLRLSPFYDNPTYLGIEISMLLGADLSPKGKIATSQTKEPSIKDYAAEFMTIDFSYICHDFHKKINMDHIENLISQSFISEKRKNAIQILINKRYEELTHALNI